MAPWTVVAVRGAKSCLAARKGVVMESTIEISEADLQRLLLAMRRRQQPMTLDELIEVLREAR